MRSRDFCFWLQGYLEVTGVDEPAALSVKQVEVLQRHLALVFKHEIDPSQGNEEHQSDLNAIHDPEQPGTKPTPPKAPWKAGGGSGPLGPVMRC